MNSGDREGRGPHRRGREPGTEVEAAYVKLRVSTWEDERVLDLSDRGKVLFLFLVSCDAARACPGIIPMQPSIIAARLRWGLTKVQRALSELEQAGMARSDGRVVFLPRAFRHNPPDGENNVVGWVKELKTRQVGGSSLGIFAIRSLHAHVLKQKGERFAEPIASSFPDIVGLGLCGFTTPSGTTLGTTSLDSEIRDQRSASSSSEPAAAAEEEASAAPLGSSEVLELVEAWEEEHRLPDPPEPAPPCSPVEVEFEVVEVVDVPAPPPALSVASPAGASEVTDDLLLEQEQLLLTWWSAHRGSLPACERLEQPERAALRRRIAEDPSRLDPAWLREVCVRAGRSSFLAEPDRMPPPTLGWFLMRGDRVSKLLAGEWDDGPRRLTGGRPEARSHVPSVEETRRKLASFTRAAAPPTPEEEARAAEARRRARAEFEGRGGGGDA